MGESEPADIPGGPPEARVAPPGQWGRRGCWFPPQVLGPSRSGTGRVSVRLSESSRLGLVSSGPFLSCEASLPGGGVAVPRTLPAPLTAVPPLALLLVGSREEGPVLPRDSADRRT